MTQPAPQCEHQYAEPPTRPAPPPRAYPQRPAPTQRPAYQPPAAQKAAPAAAQAPNKPPQAPSRPQKAHQPTPTAQPPQQTTARPAKPPPTPSPGFPDDTQAMLERLPPYDLSAEAAVIGSMIIDPDSCGPVLTFIKKPELFFDERNQIIFRIILDIWEKNNTVDALLVHSTLKTRNLLDQAVGLEYLKELANAVPTSAHAEYYASIVREKYMRRRLITALTKGLADCYDSPINADELLDASEARIFDLAQDQTLKRASVKVGEDLESHVEAMMGRTPGHLTGIATGYTWLDDMMGGLQKGEAIYIGARPSVGKTALLTGILEYVTMPLSKPCGMFSMEMNKQAIAVRMLTSMAQVSSMRMQRGFMTAEEKVRVSEAMEYLKDAPLYIDDTPGLDILGLRTAARRMVLKQGVELIGIDYLQLLSAGSRRFGTRQEEVAYFSRHIKELARELNVPIVCLSQLNRASANEQRLPRMSDLRESGAIEQDADVVMMLHRESVQHRSDPNWALENPDKVNEALLLLEKQRNGPTGTVRLTCIEKYTRFENWTGI